MALSNCRTTHCGHCGCSLACTFADSNTRVSVDTTDMGYPLKSDAASSKLAPREFDFSACILLRPIVLKLEFLQRGFQVFRLQPTIDADIAPRQLVFFDLFNRLF